MEARDAAVPSAIIVGAGFGGLRAARRLGRAPVRVTLLDRHNYHTFVPLLYQVATAGLEPEEIVQPVRRILRGAPDVRFRLVNVMGVDLGRRAVLTDAGELPYDYLVLATGSETNYFGMPQLAGMTCALRDLDDAERLRDRLLQSFEAAALTADAERQHALMTTVVVGGGPTGVELAGALAELRRHVLPKDYGDLDLSRARIILLEAADRPLPAMPPRLQRIALSKLDRLGVEVRLNTPVAGVDEGSVLLPGGERLPAGTVAWVAGLRASSLAESLGTPLARGGRVIVNEALQLPGHAEVYVIGDLAHVAGPDEAGYPMLAPVAIQQGECAADNIVAQIESRAPKPFRYADRGTMATIGRRAAVAHVFGLQINGFLAWLAWLFVHLVWLIGFRNRMLVLVNWAWNYLTYERGVRIIRSRR